MSGSTSRGRARGPTATVHWSTSTTPRRSLQGTKLSLGRHRAGSGGFAAAFAAGSGVRSGGDGKCPSPAHAHVEYPAVRVLPVKGRYAPTMPHQTTLDPMPTVEGTTRGGLSYGLGSSLSTPCVWSVATPQATLTTRYPRPKVVQMTHRTYNPCVGHATAGRRVRRMVGSGGERNSLRE